MNPKNKISQSFSAQLEVAIRDGRVKLEPITGISAPTILFNSINGIYEFSNLLEVGVGGDAAAGAAGLTTGMLYSSLGTLKVKT